MQVRTLSTASHFCLFTFVPSRDKKDHSFPSADCSEGYHSEKAILPSPPFMPPSVTSNGLETILQTVSNTCLPENEEGRVSCVPEILREVFGMSDMVNLIVRPHVDIAQVRNASF